MQSVAPSFGVELRPINVDDASKIERAMTAFARGAKGGIIVTASSLTMRHRSPIIALAARQKLPALYFQRVFVTGGGLASYGADTFDAHRRAAGYVHRILKGENPAELPVQAPTKYELVINLKTAKALGLEVPPTLLARADEVIEGDGAGPSRGSAAQRSRGRSRCVRSRRRSCRLSGSWERPLLQPGAHGLRLLCSDCMNWAGSRDDCRDPIPLGGGTHRALCRDRRRV